ncbi:MAG: hypothetical protein HKL90_04295 [Elusimicrobia bacterium]|nr:hypothetical protein [Elusimicrobiota bacterium]
MRNAALTAVLTLAALASAARAQGVPQVIGSDPLSRQILAKTSLPDSGVTAAVRTASGRVVVLQLADTSSRFAATLAPAAASPAVALAPAAGLTPKHAKKAKTRRLPKRAVKQLKRVAAVRLRRW